MRGYLMTRLAQLCGGGRLAWGLALVAQAVFFGAVHAYQSPASAVGAGLGALLYRAFYLLAGRNLWPVILAHSAWDTLAILVIYSNGIPQT